MKRTSIQPDIDNVVDFKTLKITSPAFEEGSTIPLKFTCDGDDVNPPLFIEHIPEEAKSLAIIVDDPDAPAGTWAHWVVWNIPVTHHIKEGEVHGMQGTNSFNRQRYNGPCPPSGTHRYFFKVYALDSTLDLYVSSEKSDLERAISTHILAFGELMGRYARTKKK